jgi:very-short-patch-repair endonuclease
MKQFEHAIYQISSEIQKIDKQAYKREIAYLEENRINALHAQLALIDQNIESWAKKSLKPILIDANEVSPVDAAREVVSGIGSYEWLVDAIIPSSEHTPQFGDADIATLRNARKNVSSNICYLFEKLPEIDVLPDSKEIIRLHQDLSHHAQLSQDIDVGNLIPLIDYKKETIEKAILLVENIRLLLSYRRQIEDCNFSWSNPAYEFCKQTISSTAELLTIFDKLSEDLSKASDNRKKFVERPVCIPALAEMDEEILKIVRNKIDDKRLPLGIAGIVGKSQLKAQLQEIKILSRMPETSGDWRHVQEYMFLMRSLRQIITRWNSVAPELRVDKFDSNDPSHATTAESKIRQLSLIRERIALEEKILRQALVLLPTWEHKDYFVTHESLLQIIQKALESHILRQKLSSSWADKERFQKILSEYSGEITENLKLFINADLGNQTVSDMALQSRWSSLMESLRHLLSLKGASADIRDICSRIEISGAKNWANRLRLEVANDTVDSLLPDNWRAAWRLRQLANYLDAADGRAHLKALFRQRQDAEIDLAKAYHQVVVKRTWLKLAENATPDVRSALEAFRSSIAKIGKGTGKRAVRHRQDARNAASRANHVIPCWIMPHWRISESLPPDFGCFDLVIIDESSQSDLTALPALLRAEKVLIVGDDKQVSPDGIGLEEEKIRSLMSRYLTNQVEIYRAQMTPERSIYDLFKVVFASSSTMLKEHFRCVGPIIEYSKREFYNHELKPVRLAKSSERLDPPLIDVFVQDGFKKNDVNQPEARFIVDEIKKICADPSMGHRTIGVVSLLADKQALVIWEMLKQELGPEEIEKHKIACGDAKTFQGKERSIMFLSMVSVPGDVHAQTRDTSSQRFNVAASRAQDRMYLVRSVGLDHLSPKDALRRGLIAHFSAPFAQDEARVENLRTLCESGFEREVYDILTERGYRVIPQVKVGGYRIDMVVEGHNDTRLAIECDGDQHHGADKWDDDMRRQRTLERVGWRFWRCFASIFVKNRKDVIEDLLSALKDKGIEPIGSDSAPQSIHTELRNVIAFPMTDNTANVAEDLFTDDLINKES